MTFISQGLVVALYEADKAFATGVRVWGIKKFTQIVRGPNVQRLFFFRQRQQEFWRMMSYYFQ